MPAWARLRRAPRAPRACAPSAWWGTGYLLECDFAGEDNAVRTAHFNAAPGGIGPWRWP
jgi:hypothetical protein